VNRDQILASPSMPLASPSYPRGPYRFINREYFIVTYETDPQAIRDALLHGMAVRIHEVDRRH